MSTTQSIPYFGEAPMYHPQYQEDLSPTIPAKMIKKLSDSNRVESTFDFLPAAPKRKRGDSVDEISASRQQDSCGDDDFIFPLHKRTASSNRLQSSFCLSSYDAEARDGPAEDVLDDETEALVKNFRSSIFRHEPVSPLSISPSYKEEDDEDDDICIDFPTIGRATTISDSSVSDYEDPPDMAGSRPTSPSHTEEVLGHDHDWSSSDVSLDYRSRRADKDPIEEARERPEWLSRTISPKSTSSEASQPSPLWNMSQSKGAFWQAGWTGMFHQGSA